MEDLFCCCGHKRQEENREAPASKIDVSVIIEEWTESEQAADYSERSHRKDHDGENDEQTDSHSKSSLFNVLKMLIRASPDNRFALKLYGNEQGILKEQQRQDRNCCSRWMIHPFSHFRSAVGPFLSIDHVIINSLTGGIGIL